MKPFGVDEIRALLRATPQIEQNRALFDMLQRMERERQYVPFPFSFNAVFAGIAPAATATVNVQIDAAAPFMIVNQTYQADIAGGAQTAATRVYPNMVVTLTNTSSNRQMMDVATPITSIFGDGQFPYILPEPVLMAANSVLQCTVTSQEGANTNVLQLTFSGYKLYRL